MNSIEIIKKNASTIILVSIAISAILSLTMINVYKKDEQNNTCESIKWGRILGFIFMAGSALVIWARNKAGTSILIPVVMLIINALLVKASYDDVKNQTCHSKIWMKYLGYLQAAQAILIALLYFWFTNTMNKI